MDTIAPASAFTLAHLSDEDLLASTRSMVGRSNLVLAALLAHLSEVEARGLHRNRACPSLYTYCIYELRMSEDAAYRRAQAARHVRRLPLLLEKIAAGELHLTGLLMLGPHLTEENQREVLELAKHRSKKEVAKLVRRLDPLPDAPARVEPLGPEPPGSAPKQWTWEKFMDALCPVRDLRPGERPKEWVPEDALAESNTDEPATEPKTAPPSLEAPQRYKVQFTASEEYVELLDEVRDLLGPSAKTRAVEEVHLRALRLLARELKRKKYAVSDGEAPRQRGKRRTRHVPARERRAVWHEDGGRCSYVDARGVRCRETSGLEIHHEQAFAKGGPSTRENLSLRCKAHNDLAAEQDFGRERMLSKKERPALAR
jgi:5-methylcytosine-specific restriction endonuclease McrA